jgi:hypothetical protein
MSLLHSIPFIHAIHKELNKGENIVKCIKEQRISWLGHLERMEKERMPKKIFTQEMEGTRRRGRPRKRWREKVERDLKVLGVRRCRELVMYGIGTNREVLFDRPKPTAGCSANGRRSIHFLACINFDLITLSSVPLVSKINPTYKRKHEEDRRINRMEGIRKAMNERNLNEGQ